jgi:hypothetical protein
VNMRGWDKFVVQQRTALVISGCIHRSIDGAPDCSAPPMPLASYTRELHAILATVQRLPVPINHGRLPMGRLPFAGPLDK